jgi:two-component system response regulator (stage 0 sporulation protein F)
MLPYIAFADDDAEDQELLAEQFLKHYPGTSFRFFHNGEQIARYLEKCPTAELPVLVLLDYKMPIRTGADVLKTLQGNKRYYQVRKIVWSTSGDNEYVSECMNYGAEKYFTKPNDMRELEVIIAELVEIFRGVQSGAD